MTCGKTGCRATEDTVAQVGVAPGLAVFTCPDHLQQLRANPDIERLVAAFLKVRRVYEVYFEALKGAGADLQATLRKLDEVIEAEDALKAGLSKWLLSGVGVGLPS